MLIWFPMWAPNHSQINPQIQLQESPAKLGEAVLTGTTNKRQGIHREDADTTDTGETQKGYRQHTDKTLTEH